MLAVLFTNCIRETTVLFRRQIRGLCDDLRTVLLEEAVALFNRGIRLAMVSAFTAYSVPKYIWAVDEQGEVYEAKKKPQTEIVYHGYRLREDDSLQRNYVRDEWMRRC